VTALGNIYAGGRILAADVRGVAPLAVIKGSDQSVTSNAVLQNDTALFLSVLANASYLFWCYLDFEGASGAGIQWQWAVPSGASLRYMPSYANISGTVTVGTTAADSTNLSSNGGGAAVLKGITMTGSLLTGSTAGTLQLEWAQGSSSSTPTIVHAQSFLALWQIS
jgi:hypothetical protein